MSANPAAMPWLSSNAIRALIGTMLLALLTWCGNALAVGAWDWKALALAEIPILATFIQQLFRSDVQAPAALNAVTFGAMNAKTPKVP